MTADPPTRAVSLWCHTCKSFVSVLPTYVSAGKGRTVAHHVTPNAWRAHRATHTLEASA